MEGQWSSTSIELTKEKKQPKNSEEDLYEKLRLFYQDHCMSFLLLPWQITCMFMAETYTYLLSYNSVGRNSKMDLTELKSRLIELYPLLKAPE